MGFSFYEIGVRRFCPQPLYLPTEKEISIAVFNERFWSVFVPKPSWHAFPSRQKRVGFLEEKLLAYKRELDRELLLAVF